VCTTDSSLLFDFVRVAARTLGSIYGKEGLWFNFSDHTTRAKRRHINIFWTTGKPGAKAKRKKLYQRLLRVARKTAGYIDNALKALDGCTAIWAYSVVEELRELLDLGRGVIDQTRRRVILGDSVPAEEKIVSIFEPHTDIIRKDAFDTYFGHKVLLGNGLSTLILDCLVLDGNPSDSTLVAPFIDRVAGVEATISFLKHGFGWLRCTWRSKARFHSYVYSAAAAFNLLVIGRHLVGST
jgi:IS5 family transposase